MSQIIDGRALAEKIKDDVVKEIVVMGKQEQKKIPETHECKCGHGAEAHEHEHEDPEGHEFAKFLNAPRPNLAIVLVGHREDSEIYVSLKEREARKVGIDTNLYRCPEERMVNWCRILTLMSFSFGSCLSAVTYLFLGNHIFLIPFCIAVIILIISIFNRKKLLAEVS